MNTLLNRVGEALYGDNWQAPMAEQLDVNERTLRRWVAGTAGVPSGVWADLFVRLDVKRDAITHLIDGIKREIDK